MPLFSLEALDARSGDALLVHYGEPADPRLLVVDGGFTTTYSDRFAPRVEELRAGRGLDDAEPFPIDHLIVSHIDDDHILGVVRLFEDMAGADDRGRPLPYRVRRLWHNSFDDSLQAATEATVQPATLLGAARSSDARTASVANGRRLRDLAERFGLSGNSPFAGLVLGPRVIDLGDGVEATVVGPDAVRLQALRTAWQEEVEAAVEAGDAEAAARVAAYVDEGVPNLSSVVVHLRSGDRTMLLTGDARGDDTLRGLEAAGLLGADGRCHVDVLKLPHHGSDRNVEPGYFEAIVADHYVVSANGRHDNPSPATLQMLTASQGDRPYTIHLTYPVGVDVLDADRAANDRNYEVAVRGDGELGLRVDLADPGP